MLREPAGAVNPTRSRWPGVLLFPLAGTYHGKNSSGSESTFAEFMAMSVSPSETGGVGVVFCSFQPYMPWLAAGLWAQLWLLLLWLRFCRRGGLPIGRGGGMVHTAFALAHR